MRTSRYGDDPLPPLSLARVVENRHGSWRLHDLREEPRGAAEIREDRSHAALAQRPILGIVGAIDDAASGHAGGQIRTRRLGAAWWRRAVPATLAARQLVLTRVGRLQESELELPQLLAPLGDLRGNGRNAPVGRIDDQRGAPTRVFVGKKDRSVVRPADVLFAST